MIEIVRYTPDAAARWDEFIFSSELDCFLLQRGFMEYHADRFTDHSLLFLSEGQLLAVLPANSKGDTLASHGGLTFAGLVCRTDLELRTRRSLYERLIDYAATHQIRELKFKLAPDYYRKATNQADLHFLAALGARLDHANTAFVVALDEVIKLGSRRKRALVRAEKEGVRAAVSNDLKTYWQTILEPNLLERFAAKPVHTLPEIEKLAQLFKNKIELLAAFNKEGAMLAGIVFFVNDQVAHTQYISANSEGRDCGALDRIVHLAFERYQGRRFLSFGTSNEDDGRAINWGLADWKLEFGAKIFAHPTFLLTVEPKP